MNPIGLIVIGIYALVAAFVIAYQKSEKFRDVIKGAMVSIGAALIDDDGRLVVGAQGRWAYGFDELVTELARLQSTYEIGRAHV